MPLLLERTIGNASVAFADLVEIVRCDPGLTFFTPTDFVYQVQYTQKKAAVASSTRVLELVNSPVTVIISAVTSEFSPSADIKLIDYAGLTRVRLAPDQSISIWYDVTDAAGRYYSVKDKDGQDIYMPRQVILYHELSHAYHDIKGDLPAAKREREIQGMADENVFRAQLGLPLRNATNYAGGPGTPSHGGVTFPACKPEQKGWSPGWKCPSVIATEAIGSPHAPQIEELRRARAKYRTVGLWFAQIAQPTLELYARIGPGVARHMQSHPALRDAMLWYVVQPTCLLLRIAEAYLAADADTPIMAATVNDALINYVSAIEGVDGSGRALRGASRGAAAASRLLASGARPESEISTSPERPDRLFSYLAREILSVKGGTPAAFAWGFEGLALFLQQAARIADSLAIGDVFPSELASWVARLPLPAVPHLHISDAHRELSVLGQRIFTRPDTRALFARHLRTHWPSSSTADLQALLADLGYLSGARRLAD